MRRKILPQTLRVRRWSKLLLHLISEQQRCHAILKTQQLHLLVDCGSETFLEHAFQMPAKRTGREKEPSGIGRLDLPAASAK